MLKSKIISNKNETARLFKSSFLEYFSHIHPATPVVFYTPVTVWALWNAFSLASVPAVLAMFVVGVLAWTLTEYILHRFIFHLHFASMIGQRIHFLFHGIHHAYPRDATRLVMPLAISIPIAFIVYFGFKAMFGVYFWGAFAGMVVGYVAYDSIHFATHHWPMKSKMGRFLKEYHMKHHYTDDDSAYGVSSPLWDYVFSTVPQWARDRSARKTTKASD